MDKRLEDDDGTALAGLSNAPPRRQIHSYSHQLRTSTGTHHKRRQHQLRNHSLDENHILNKHANIQTHDDSSDDLDFRPSFTTAASFATGGDDIGSVSDHRVDYRIDGDGGDESQQQFQQPMPEFMGSGGSVGIFKAPKRAAVHPCRPPFLELRPHPLRETQVQINYFF